MGVSKYKKRNIGIDILKSLSMLMIVFLHMCSQGGILKNVEYGTAKYFISWSIYIFCFCAVNCFALVSGYVMFNRKIKVSRLLNLWLQILFYTVGISAIMFILFKDLLTVPNVLNAVFPITTKSYWYLSAYFFLYLLIPVLNYGINNMPKKYIQLFIIFIILYSFICTLLNGDPFSTYNGYSTLWLIVMYIIGAYIRKYGLPFVTNNLINLIVFLLCILTTIASKFVLAKLGFDSVDEILIKYNSPTMIVASISLLLWFKNLNIKEKYSGFFNKISAVSLGVYIIHEMPLIVEMFLKGSTIRLLKYNTVVFSLSLVGISFAIFVLCILIDYIRLKLFQLCRINILCVKIEVAVKRVYRNICLKISAANEKSKS